MKPARRSRRSLQSEDTKTIEVLDRLRRGRSLDDLALAHHDGRIDLRGMQFPKPLRGSQMSAGRLAVQELEGLVTLRGVQLSRIDFSEADLRSFRLIGCEIQDCRFDRAKCQDWRLWDCTIQDSAFCDADLRDSAIGTWQDNRGNRWRRVDFTKARLEGATALCAHFDGCEFADTRLRDVQFKQCSLKQSRFAGPLRDVSFDGRALTGLPAPPELKCDFEKAGFDGVDFVGYSLTEIVLPADPEITLVPNIRCVAEWICEATGEDDRVASRQLRGVMANWLKLLDAASSLNPSAAVVFNRRDWRAWGGPDLEDLAVRLVGEGTTICAS
jgi:uncharacterized protein YjbI with pentapeptide repeats